MAKVNPPIVPSTRAYELEAEVRANGGTLTAVEFQQSMDWERHGWSQSRTGALRMAGPEGAIFGESGNWGVYRRRPTQLSQPTQPMNRRNP